MRVCMINLKTTVKIKDLTECNKKMYSRSLGKYRQIVQTKTQANTYNR